MNCITIEFCAEDRSRIDRLIAALERRDCERCVATALEWKEQVQAGQEAAAQNSFDPIQSEPDPIQQKAAEVMAKFETPAPAPEPAPAPAPKAPPSLEEFQKALTLRCAESDATKAKVRALLHEYAAAASQVPEDKRAEVLARLAKL